MKSSLFAPAPRRKRGLILTLAGSLLFHGSLIGVAALWPTHSVQPPPGGVTVVDFVASDPPGVPLPPEALPSEPEPVAAPMLATTDPVDNPPPAAEPSPDDMTLATPVPRPASRASSRVVPTSATTRIVHPPGNLSTGGPATGAVGNAGSGRPGPGVRWVTPKPVYPAPLRAAHVQGNGSVRVTTDGAGRVVSATIVQSTGNALLDDTTCRAARNGWSGPANSTILVPVTYQLQ